MITTPLQRLGFLAKLSKDLKAIAFAARFSKPMPPSNVGLRTTSTHDHHL